MEISDDGKLTFKLPTFEGPLDLLLHLIKKNEMDIYDIPMSKITSQYIDYLHQMQSLELDIACRTACFAPDVSRGSRQFAFVVGRTDETIYA